MAAPSQFQMRGGPTPINIDDVLMMLGGIQTPGTKRGLRQEDRQQQQIDQRMDIQELVQDRTDDRLSQDIDFRGEQAGLSREQASREADLDRALKEVLSMANINTQESIADKNRAADFQNAAADRFADLTNRVADRQFAGPLNEAQTERTQAEADNLKFMTEQQRRLFEEQNSGVGGDPNNPLNSTDPQVLQQREMFNNLNEQINAGVSRKDQVLGLLPDLSGMVRTREEIARGESPWWITGIEDGISDFFHSTPQSREAAQRAEAPQDLLSRIEDNHPIDLQDVPPDILAQFEQMLGPALQNIEGQSPDALRQILAEVLQSGNF